MLKSEVDQVCSGEAQRPLDIALNSAFEGDDVIVETDKTKTANLLSSEKGIPLKKVELLLPPSQSGSNKYHCKSAEPGDTYSLDVDVIMLHNMDAKTSTQVATDVFDQVKSKMGEAMETGEEFSDQGEEIKQTFLNAVEEVFLPCMFMVPSVSIAVIQIELFSPRLKKGISSSNQNKSLSVLDKLKGLNIKK